MFEKPASALVSSPRHISLLLKLRIYLGGWEKIKTPFTLVIPALSILVNTIDWYDFYFLLQAL